MERIAGTTARSQRLIGFAASGLLAVATAWAFGRVFSGTAPTWKLLAAGLASAAVAVGLERRNLILATFVSLGVLAVAVAWLVFPSTTLLGLPSLETLDAAVRSSHLVTEQAQAQAAPTAPLAPLLLAAVVAMWAAIFSSHALAFRAGSPLLALLPPVALVGFADTVLEEMFRPLYGLPFLAAALFVAFADAIRRVVSWGTVWIGRHPSQGLLAVAGRGARPVALSVLVAAALSPAVVPGLGSPAVIDLNSGAGRRVGVDPFVDIRDALTQSDVQPVFRVETPQPAYLRMLSLDSFDGGRWRAGPSSAVETHTSADPLPPLTPSSGLTMDARITAASDLALTYLPLPYPPASIEIDRAYTFEVPSNAVSVGDPLDEGDSYLVQTSLIRPTPEALQLEESFLPAPAPRDLQLPPDLPADIAQLARAWTADASTTYDKVLAIQDHLTDTAVFSYDDKVAARSDSFTLVDFLFETRRGFCQQFSSAMAVMLRVLGIPSRIAVGFTSGHRVIADGSQAWEITTQDAHAWVEVLFPSYGWLAFEPTPGRINPVASIYTNPVEGGCPPGTPGCAGSPTGGGGPTSTASPVLPRQVNPVPRVDTPGSLAPGEVAARFTWRRGIVLVAGAVLLALAVVPPVRWLRRRLRLRRVQREPVRLILATYDVFADRAADLGFARGPGETIGEYRRRVPMRSSTADDELGRLTSIVTLAAYAPVSLGREDALVAREAADTALRDLRRQTPLPRRVAGMYRRP